MTILIEHDLRPMLAPVRDQWDRPTCLAHATSAAHEVSRGSSALLSPQYLHYYAVNGASAIGCGFPAMIDTLRDHGQPLESDCPYSIDEPDSLWRPPSGVAVFRRAAQQSLGDAIIRPAIEASSVAVLGLHLSASFRRPAPPWIIRPDGTMRGLHAVAAVGLGSEAGKQLVLIRNSWGADWADDGHAWLDEDFVQAHVIEVLVMREEIT